MSGDDFWNNQTENSSYLYYGSDYSGMQQQHLEFNGEDMSFTETGYADTYANSKTNYEEFSEELPLLEELEIYPDRIIEKTLAVLNPFQSRRPMPSLESLLKDSDLAGPVAFCVILAVCLFVSGSKAHFGYIYGLSVVSCLMMYVLLTLMTARNEVFTVSNVASTLGYCMLPIVILALIAIFTSIRSNLGIFLAVLAIFWSTLSASRLFVAMSGDVDQRVLVAYPCLLVYGVFAVIVVF